MGIIEHDKGDGGGSNPVFSKGETVEARWKEPAKDGKFYHYAATIHEVHDGGASYTVRWKESDGYEPTSRLEARFVRDPTVTVPIVRKNRYPKSFVGNAKYANVEVNLPSVSSKGRKVTKVSRYRSSSECDDMLNRAIIASSRKEIHAGEWIGEPRQYGDRKFFDAVKLRNNCVIRAGDCVQLSPPRASSSGWQSSLPWVTLVTDLFEDSARNMMFTGVWFYRPHDCSPLSIRADTVVDKEVFLTDETDENNLKSVIGKCLVLGDEAYQENIRTSKHRSSVAASSHKPLVARSEALDSNDDSSCGEDQQPLQSLLCRYRYDLCSTKMVPIKDTAQALLRSSSGLLLEQKITAHIRDFQVKWIACLRRYGHLMNTEVSEAKPSASHRHPKAHLEAHSSTSDAKDIVASSPASTAPRLSTSPGSTNDDGSAPHSPLDYSHAGATHCRVKQHSLRGSDTHRGTRIERCINQWSMDDVDGSLSVVSAIEARETREGWSKRRSDAVNSTSAASTQSEAKRACQRKHSDNGSSSPTQRDKSKAKTQQQNQQPETAETAAGSVQGKRKRREEAVVIEANSTPYKRTGTELVASKKLKVSTMSERRETQVPEQLQYVHGEFVDVKIQGKYYPAFVVKKVFRKQQKFTECVVEWLDPENHQYNTDGGHQRTSIVPIADMRPSKAKLPAHLVDPNAPLPPPTHTTDWESVAEKVASERPTANAGLEWYPRLSRVRDLPGFKTMWVCMARHCGHAFADKNFLRVHQISANHGKWAGLNPKVRSSGASTVTELDCTRSGDVVFASSSVEKKMRKFVKQTSTSEEPRIDIDDSVPCKVLHTGEGNKGFGLFAARDIKDGEYIGHYSGEIRDVGYENGFSGHYTFALLHGLVIDGTAGGAFRFMNHCLEKQHPSVRALIVNHRGMCRVALYANRNVRAGEELLLRYGDISDAKFFGMECGQD